jgi:hypothetical protein
MTSDRRSELGFDPEGLHSRFCPTCAEMVTVRTERDEHGTKHYFCEQCGSPLGEEARGGFDPPDFPDA